MSVVFFILFLIPFTILKDYVTKSILSQIDEIKVNVRANLKEESEKYIEKLDPFKKLGNIIEQVEKKVGFVSSYSADLKLMPNVDPKLVKKDFISRFNTVLYDEYGIKPLCVFATDYNYKNYYSYYSPKYFTKFPARLKQVLPIVLLAGHNGIDRIKYIADNKLLDKTFIECGYFDSKNTPNTVANGISSIGLQTFYMQKYFSPCFYVNNSNKENYEYVSKNFNSTKIY